MGGELALVLDDQDERQFMARVIGWAELGGWRHFHGYSSVRSPVGFPDLVLLRDGVCLVVELKTNHGYVSIEQADWLDDWQLVPGVTACLWQPQHWRAVRDFLVQGGRYAATDVGPGAPVPGVWNGDRSRVRARRYGGRDSRRRAALRRLWTSAQRGEV